MTREGTGTKKQRDQLRAAMHDQGCTLEQIAKEMARQFGYRERQAWRHTHGLTQDEVAAAYNRLLNNDQAPMTGKRIGNYEAWPHGGVKPTINTLAMLAKVYSTEICNLVDLDDRQAYSQQELITLDAYKTPPPATVPKSPDTSLKNNAQRPTTTDERTAQSESPIPITAHHSNTNIAVADDGHPGSLPLRQAIAPAPDQRYPVRTQRRKADRSTLSHLLLSLPQFLCSYIAISSLALYLGGIVESSLIILCWLASGLIFVIYRPAEEILARVYFQCRKPTLAQKQLLDRLWGDVTNAAGVDASKYTLWVQDSKTINAFAGGGHIVGVTRYALEKQPPNQLTAVLAHELGHHIGGHSWSLLLSSWYALPGRLALRLTWIIIRFVTGFALAAAMEFSIIGCLVAYFILAGLASFTFAVAPFLLVIYLILPILAWFDRNSEKQADQFAAEIGYGPLLIDALHAFQQQDDTQDIHIPLIARLMATHPPLHDRIRRLEKFDTR